MTHRGEGKAKRDMDWCATADLEGVKERDIPGYLRALGRQHYYEVGADPPSVGELLRARLNMQKHAARARRADAAAQAELNHAIARKWFAIAMAAAPLFGLLWLAARLWA